MITTLPKLIYFWHAPCGHGAGPYDFEEMAAKAEREHRCDRWTFAPEVRPSAEATKGGPWNRNPDTYNGGD